MIYTQLVVAAWKNGSELSEAKEVRSKAAKLETGEGNTVLASLTEQVVYLMAFWIQKAIPWVVKEIQRDNKIE